MRLNPKLRFDGTTMFSSNGICGSKQYTEEFIQNVNAVLHKHNGEFVQDFELKFELNSELVVHLDNWVRFVVASQVKNLAIDLVPVKFHGRTDRYLLPNKLLDIRTASRLQHVQLGFMSIRLPSQFSGFPNLRMLDLHMINVTAKDIEEMLSSCSNLEWLRIVRCHLDDELKVDLPLPCLLYLCVAYCRISRIKFNAMKLQTFECMGGWYPFELIQSLELKDACLDFIDSVTLDYALTTLPTVLPSVENLILRARAPLKTPSLLENTCKFIQLKYLQLELAVLREDVGNIRPVRLAYQPPASSTFLSEQTSCQQPDSNTFLSEQTNTNNQPPAKRTGRISLASFFRAAPLVEKLELHFKVFYSAHSDWEPLRMLPRFSHNHLKDLYITGFIACTGQLEFLLHAVENAPVLEVLTLNPAFKFDEGMDYEGRAGFFSQVREISRRYLSGRVSPTTKLYIL